MRITWIKPAMIATFAFAGVAVLAVASAPNVVKAADDDARPVKHSFPTPVAKADSGRKAVETLIKKDELDAEAVADKLFDGMPMQRLAHVIRARLAADEVRALDTNLADVDLAALMAATKSDAALSAALDKAGATKRGVVKALTKVFKDWYPLEVAAYFAKQGYSESWMATRLKGDEAGDERWESLIKSRTKDIEHPGSIWDTETSKWTLEQELSIGRTVERQELQSLFKEYEKVLTPEIERVFRFNDPALCAAALSRAGIGGEEFAEWASERLSGQKGDAAKALAAGLLDRLGSREEALEQWFRTRGDDVIAVYGGSSSPLGAFPVLGALECATVLDADLPDYGITASIEKALEPAATARLVIYKNGTVRALFGDTRLEGWVDREKFRKPAAKPAEPGKDDAKPAEWAGASLDLVAQYGGADRSLRGMKLHGGGVLLEMKLVGAPAEANRMLWKRVSGY